VRRRLLFQGETLRSAPGVLFAAVAGLVGAISWSMASVYSRRSHLSGIPCSSPHVAVSGEPCCSWPVPSFGEWGRVSWAAISPRSAVGARLPHRVRLHRSVHSLQLALERYSPALATHTYVNPVVAVLLGWWLAGERVTLSMGVAARMILAAILLVDAGRTCLSAE